MMYGIVKKFVAIYRLMIIEPRLISLVFKIKRLQYTFLSYSKIFVLVSEFHIANQRAREDLNVAEFGVGRGGSAMVLAWLINRYGGNIVLYDVFGRIPAPTEVDGKDAQQRYDHIVNCENEAYYGNISNLLDLILEDLAAICSLDNIRIVSGRYEETLLHLEDTEVFDLVHIDCDWYESVKAVFKYLEHRLSPNSIIQVDDYGRWAGANQATKEVSWLSGYDQNLVDGALVIDMGSPKN